jgi:RNase adaptor protein for sRNA GlmZ degradation
MLSLESGGCKAGCVPFQRSEGWVVISAKGLPNPYGTIKKGELEDELKFIRPWIETKDPKKWKQKVRACLNALRDGKHVRVECAGGQHRSYSLVETVAKMYGEMYGCDLKVLHNDRKI